MKPTLAVVGGINMDLVVQDPRLPGPGETVVGGRFSQHHAGARIDGEATFPAPATVAVDTTGAGDCFNGVLAAGLAEGLELPIAVGRAVGPRLFRSPSPAPAKACPPARSWMRPFLSRPSLGDPVLGFFKGP